MFFVLKWNMQIRFLCYTFIFNILLCKVYIYISSYLHETFHECPLSWIAVKHSCSFLYYKHCVFLFFIISIVFFYFVLYALFFSLTRQLVSKSKFCFPRSVAICICHLRTGSHATSCEDILYWLLFFSSYIKTSV